MKKLVKVLLVLIIVATTVSVLYACTPPNSGGNGGGKNNTTTSRDNYGVTPLADLADYSTKSVAATAYATNASEVAGDIAELDGKIASLNDEYYEDTLNSFQKIFKNSDGTEIVRALGNSGLSKDKMSALVKYVVGKKSDGAYYSLSDAKATTEATGLIEDYSAIAEWEDELERLTPDTDEYNTVYKKRYSKSWSMNETLKKTGMDGGDAARALVYVMFYAQKVVKSEKMAGSVNMTDYFKETLYTRVYDVRSDKDETTNMYEHAEGETYSYDRSAYELLIALRAYNGVRWTKDQTDAVVTESASDGKAKLIRAWGYSYDYEMATHNALTKEEYDKNVDYTLKSSLSDKEAVEAAKIQRKLYAGGYRYSDSFYTKYYDALKDFAEKEELHEARVYGFVTETSTQTGMDNNTFVIDGNGVLSGSDSKYSTEASITVDMGAVKDRYVTQFGAGVKAGMKSSLLASDMEYHYSKTDANVTAQAAAQRTMANNKSISSGDYNATYYNAQYDLEITNLKSANYVMSQFLIETSGNKELQQLLIYQIYNTQSDYIRSAKRLKASIYLTLQELVKEGVYTVTDGKTYTLDKTAENYDAETVYNVGRDNASLNSLTASYGELSVKSQVDQAGNANFKDNNNTQGVNGNVKSVLDSDSTFKKSNGKARVTSLNEALVKQVYKGKSGKKYSKLEAEAADAPQSLLDDIQGKELEYDNEWEISRLLINHEKVVYYTAGQVQIEFKVLTSSGSSVSATKYDKKESDTVAYNEAIGEAFLPSVNSTEDLTIGDKTYTTNKKWYLKYEYADGSLSFYYEADKDTAFKYDSTLYLGYVLK